MIQPRVIDSVSGHGASIAAAESVKLRTSTSVVRWVRRIDAFTELSWAWTAREGVWSQDNAVQERSR